MRRRQPDIHQPCGYDCAQQCDPTAAWRGDCMATPFVRSIKDSTIFKVTYKQAGSRGREDESNHRDQDKANGFDGGHRVIQGRRGLDIAERYPRDDIRAYVVLLAERIGIGDQSGDGVSGSLQ